MKKVKTPNNIEHSCCHTTLKEVIEYFTGYGLTSKDFGNIEIELDYGGCYYESDTPSVVAIYTKPKK